MYTFGNHAKLSDFRLYVHPFICTKITKLKIEKVLKSLYVQRNVRIRRRRRRIFFKVYISSNFRLYVHPLICTILSARGKFPLICTSYISLPEIGDYTVPEISANKNFPKIISMLYSLGNAIVPIFP